MSTRRCQRLPATGRRSALCDWAATGLCCAGLVACSTSGSAPPANPGPPAPSVTACPTSAARSALLEEPELLIQDGHSQPINLLALSGDGALLASASLDQTLRLWDVESGLLLRRLTAPGATYGLALDRAGAWLAYAHGAVGGKPHAVRVRRLADEAEHELPYGPFALSPDGASIAIGTGPVELFATASGERLRVLATETEGEVHAVAFDATGQRIAVAVAATVVLCDAATGALLARVPFAPEPLPPGSPPNVEPVMSAVYEVAFADGALVCTRGTRKLQLLAPDGTVRTLAAPPGQSAVAAGTLWTASASGELWRFELPSGRARGSRKLPSAPFRIALSGDGRTLASAYLDPLEGYTIQLADAATGHLVRTIEGRDTSVRALAMTRDGRQLAVGSQTALGLWSLPRGELWFSTPDRRLRASRQLSYDGAGRQLAAVEAGRVRIRAAATGRLLRAWRFEGLDLALLAFRPGGSALLTVSEEGAIEEADLAGELPAASSVDADDLVRDLARPPIRRLGSVGFRVEAAALSPDGEAIVVAADSSAGLADAGQVALHDGRTGRERWRVESRTSFGRWLGFSGDGRRVLLSGYRYVPVAQMEAGQMGEPILRAFAAETGALVAEAAPPTAGPLAARGDLVAMGGSRPVIVDATTLGVRAEIALRDAHVGAVLAHPTLNAFVLGGIGGSTALVSSAGALEGLLVSAPGGDYIATTPEGAYRASLDGSRSLAWTFRRPLEAYSFEQFASRYERPDVVAHRLAAEPSPALPRVSRPPRVALAGPRRRASDGRTTTVRASVRSHQRVDRVRVFANGRLVAEERVCAPAAALELTVPLVPGANRLAVVAYDADGFASHPAFVDVESRAAGRRPELWIVTIGVSRYPRLSPRHQLAFADDDARAMAAALAALSGPGRLFGKSRTVTLVDGEVSVARIERALAALAGMQRHDLAVVFLAGHGLRLGDGKMHFLTEEASLAPAALGRGAIGWAELERALGQAAGRVVVLLDACHSGHVTTEPIAPNEELARALAADDRTGLLVFAASRGAQWSYEVGGGTGTGPRGLELAWPGQDAFAAGASGLAARHGLFTSAMLEALAGRAPDRDRSGATELGELVDYVTERVRSASNGQQTPWVARRELFGDFPLVPRP